MHQVTPCVGVRRPGQEADRHARTDIVEPRSQTTPTMGRAQRERGEGEGGRGGGESERGRRGEGEGIAGKASGHRKLITR